MKRLLLSSLLLVSVAVVSEAATQITGYVQVNPPIAPQPGSFNISSGIVGQFQDTGLSVGGCVQASNTGFLSVTGTGCGSGGGRRSLR